MNFFTSDLRDLNLRDATMRHDLTDDLRRLVDDIKVRGQRDPISVEAFRDGTGKIRYNVLDGRLRILAMVCIWLETGVDQQIIGKQIRDEVSNRY